MRRFDLTRTVMISMSLAAFAATGLFASGCSNAPLAKPRQVQPYASMPSVAEDDAFLDAFAKTSKFSLGRPRSFAMSPDGASVLFLRSQSRSFQQDLFEFDCVNGKERVLLTADAMLGGGQEKLSAEELARRERMRMTTRGISAYELSKDGKKILVPLSGRLFVVDRASGKRVELSSKSSKAGESPLDPRFSPDGSLVASVRGGEVFIADADGARDWQVTSGSGGTITNGTAEFVAQEEMGRFEGYWFSPDSRRLCYQQTDTAGVEEFNIADPLDPAKKPESWPYPRAGAKNAVVKLAITGVDGKGKVTWIKWESEKFPYVARVSWKKNAPLTVLVQNRAQTQQLLLAVEDETGATAPLLTETDAAWINLYGGPKWLEDGTGFLWQTEQYEGAKPGADFPRLELRNRNGTLNRVIVAGDRKLDGLVALDSTHRVVYVECSPTPARSQVVRYPLDGGEPVAMTEAPGRNGAAFSENFTTWLETANLANGKLQWRVRRTDGKVVGEIASMAEAPPAMPNLEVTTVGHLVGQDRDYWAAIVRPRAFEKGRRYPVIVSVYGGPTSNTVNDTPMGYILQQWYADHGFIVVSIEGRGTPRRGRAWERATRLNLIDIPLDDQAQALRLLGAKYPEMDLTRVGITGWSFGGYFTAMATMRRPEIFRCGVAGAPVCSWEDYDTHYTERYMGMPAENAAGYKASDVLTYCKDLSVPLMIVHGTSDDNVYFAHSLKMTRELFRNGKAFDFLPLAGFTHVVAEPTTVNRLQKRIIGYFVKHLQ